MIIYCVSCLSETPHMLQCFNLLNVKIPIVMQTKTLLAWNMLNMFLL